MFSLISTFVLVIIAAGIYFRKTSKIHIPLMLIAFVIDFSLVIAIELQRKAVENVVSEAIDKEPDSFVLFHAGISLLVLVFYVVMIVTGMKLRKDRTYLVLHKYSAIIFIILRLTNYATSFFMA